MYICNRCKNSEPCEFSGPSEPEICPVAFYLDPKWELRQKTDKLGFSARGIEILARESKRARPGHLKIKELIKSSSAIERL